MKYKNFITTITGEVLIFLKNNPFKNYTQKIKVDCAISTLFKLVHILKDAGLLTETKCGRKNILKLTEKGKSVTNHLIKIKGLLNET